LQVALETERVETLTPRQGEVLDAVLALLVEGRDALTMSAVARRASCSKETLYKWFGDRDGLLTATVRWQAAKVRTGSYERQRLDAAALRESLEDFAATWLRVISSKSSIALNRVAISHAGSGKSNLGRIVLAKPDAQPACLSSMTPKRLSAPFSAWWAVTSRSGSCSVTGWT
jgi:AcrR family transcriptional regulator